MSDEEDDPFERLGESVGDREGDPFEQFEDVEDREASGDESADESESDAETESGDSDATWVEEPRTGDEPAGEREPGYDAHDVTPADHLDGEETTAESETGVVEQEEPSIDVSSDTDTDFSDVGREGDPFEDEVFEEMDVGELDPDEVWESIAEAQEEGSVSEPAERIYAEVSKHRYCEQCEFFSDPPDVECTHEGTEILEFLDQETVRVVDCPIVAERKELEKHE